MAARHERFVMQFEAGWGSDTSAGRVLGALVGRNSIGFRRCWFGGRLQFETALHDRD